MKVAAEEWTQVTQVLATYVDRDEIPSTQRESDNTRYNELVTCSTDIDPQFQTRWLLSTNSSAKVKWDLTVLLLCLYNTLVVPLELAFDVDQFVVVKAMDYATNCLFAVDIIVNFRCSYLNEMNDEVWDVKLIAKRYIMGAFALDVIACIPFELLFALADVSVNPRPFRLVVLLKLIRLVRLRHILFFLRAKSEFKLSLQLFLLMASLLLFTHIFACVWFTIVSVDAQWRPPNFLNKHEDFYSEMDPIDQYLTSFYFIKLLSGGYDAIPETPLEAAFGAMITTCGSIFSAILLGFTTVTLASLSQQSSAYIDSLDSLQQTMLRLHLSVQVQSHVTAYFEYTHRSKHMQQNLQTFLGALSSPLRVEVIRILVTTTLRRNPLFTGRDRALLVVEASVRLRTFNPEESVFLLGSDSEDFFVLCSGEVLIETRRAPGVTSCSRVLKSGMAFGEVGLLMNCKRTASASTKNFSAIGSISKSQFDEMLAAESAMRAELSLVVLSYQDEWRRLIVKALAFVPYLRKCSFDELQELSFAATEVHFACGQEIVSRGQKTHNLLLLAVGRVSGWLKSQRRGDICVLKLSQGDLAGIYSVLDRSPAALRLVADSDCVVVQISVECLNKFARKCRSAAVAIAESRGNFSELFEKTGDFQLRALANISEGSPKERVMARFQMLMLRVICHSYRRQRRKSQLPEILEMVRKYQGKVKDMDERSREEAQAQEFRRSLLAAKSNLLNVEQRLEVCEEVISALAPSLERLRSEVRT